MAERGVRTALVTGAAGGMGAACARRLGRDHPLFLTDIDAAGLAALCSDLETEGISVAGKLVLDLTEDGAARELLATVAEHAPPGPVVHTAGLSPSMGSCAALMRLNARGTHALLDALEQHLDSGMAAVVIASMAGHTARSDSDIDALCGTPTNDNFIADVEALLVERSGGDNARKASDAAYLYSKRANLLDVQRRSALWSASGARINSISPGLVDTNMGRREVAGDDGAAQMLSMQPLGWVSVGDIAETVAFLVSPASKAITGTDLKVDGGLCAALFGGRTTTGACAA